MIKIYEIDKINILNKIDTIQKTINGRLNPTFESIEEEANQIEKETLDELSRVFNPETMDESEVYEKAYHRAVEHYNVQREMKIEFLKSAVSWIFHLFEKDCTYVFNTENGDKKIEYLTTLDIDTCNSSNWYKCNKELRVLTNSIKHGKGYSFNTLKEIRPDLIGSSESFLSKNNIIITIENINEYIECMKLFWESLFEKILP